MTQRELSERIETTAREFFRTTPKCRKLMLKPDLDERLKKISRRNRAPIAVMRKIIFYELD